MILEAFPREAAEKMVFSADYTLETTLSTPLLRDLRFSENPEKSGILAVSRGKTAFLG